MSCRRDPTSVSHLPTAGSQEQYTARRGKRHPNCIDGGNTLISWLQQHSDFKIHDQRHTVTQVCHQILSTLGKHFDRKKKETNSIPLLIKQKKPTSLPNAFIFRFTNSPKFRSRETSTRWSFCYVGVRLIRRLIYHRFEPQSVYDVSFRSSLGRFLNKWSNSLGFCEKSAHLRVLTHELLGTRRCTVHSYTLTTTLTQNTTKHFNSVHIWISLATVCYCFFRVSGCALLILC